MAKKKTPRKRSPQASLRRFVEEAEPLEGEADSIPLLVDKCTGATYCECHVAANVIITLGTVDVPIDPEEQEEYRANREILWDHAAFKKMVADAHNGRSFSNIVSEYTREFNPKYPIKIIGGQHRYQAIKKALDAEINEYHGMKVYLGLTPEQRLDAQLISNTNLAVSPDLLDRMRETQRGPALRDWCQAVGFLQPQQDFTDKYERGGPISVQMARTFILNYYLGKGISPKNFERTETIPKVCPRGQEDAEWEELVATDDNIWTDSGLEKAAQEFFAVVRAQREWFKSKKARRDRPEKALNIAVLSAWAFVAGVLQQNTQRLKRHFDLRKTKGKDPLNANALDKGKHKTDDDSYRGLGFRTDPRERGRFVELFYLQAEKGTGVTSAVVRAAIANYHAKVANLEAIKAKEKVG